MSLTYFDFFSFFNNFSFIVSSVNKTFFASACKCLKTFFSSFIVSTQFSIFFYQFILLASDRCYLIFFSLSCRKFVSMFSSASRIYVFSSSMSTYVSPKALYLCSASFLIRFSCEILDLFVFWLIFLSRSSMN